MGKKVRLSFKDAVVQTPDVANCYMKGLQALGQHSEKIKPSETTHCNGSVSLDDSVKHKYPQASRWDYILAYKSAAYFVEVHTASTSEVSTVLRKLQWLKDWLRDHAPKINQLKAGENPFIWIQTDGFHIPKNSRQFRQISQAGLKPISKLMLN